MIEYKNMNEDEWYNFLKGVFQDGGFIESNGLEKYPLSQVAIESLINDGIAKHEDNLYLPVNNKPELQVI